MQYIAFGACIFALLVTIGQFVHVRHLQRTIDRQQDTIQRLINREPVTYAETGQEQHKAPRQFYAAWGAQIVDLSEDVK